VEQRDIEIFLTLADELHFGRAAERLHVSTARVSQTIKKLERRIGAPLFERTSRRVELTPIGGRLRDGLRPAYAQIQDSIDRAMTAARGVVGTLRVGFIGAASGRFVLEVAEAFRAEHVDSEVSLRENQFGEGLGPLRGGEIDMVLATLPVSGARQADLTAGSVLLEEAQLLAVSARHPFARRPSVSFADLARTKVLRTPPAISEYWDRLLVPPHTLDGRPVE
jgi:DNA-binding transcriptional LysR family regulator